MQGPNKRTLHHENQCAPRKYFGIFGALISMLEPSLVRSTDVSEQNFVYVTTDFGQACANLQMKYSRGSKSERSEPNAVRNQNIFTSWFRMVPILNIRYIYGPFIAMVPNIQKRNKQNGCRFKQNGG